MASDGYVEETWTFAGLRYDGKEKKHVWIDGNNKELSYKAKSGYRVVGARYRVEVKRTEDSILAHLSTAVYDSQLGLSDPHRLEYEAADIAAKALVAAGQRERQAGQQTALDDALRPLRTVAAKMRTRAERDAFTAHVLRTMSGWW